MSFERKMTWMTGVLSLDAALLVNTGPEPIWANEAYFGMNHAPGAGSIAQTVDLKSSALLLSYDCPL